MPTVVHSIYFLLFGAPAAASAHRRDVRLPGSAATAEMLVTSSGKEASSAPSSFSTSGVRTSSGKASSSRTQFAITFSTSAASPSSSTVPESSTGATGAVSHPTGTETTFPTTSETYSSDENRSSTSNSATTAAQPTSSPTPAYSSTMASLPVVSASQSSPILAAESQSVTSQLASTPSASGSSSLPSSSSQPTPFASPSGGPPRAEVNNPASSPSTLPASSGNTQHGPSLGLILGPSIGGGVVLIAAATACLVCLVRKRRRRSKQRARAPSRSESFFAPERPLVSPFPTLTRPPSRMTATTTAGTISDEARWAEYRSAYQVPPNLPGAVELASRDALLGLPPAQHQHGAQKMFATPAPASRMGYAVLARSSPHSATFPHEPQYTADGLPVPTQDASRMHAPTPALLSPPLSASFPQDIAYDGISLTSDTITTPSGQRIPVPAIPDDDTYMPSPGVLSLRRSISSLRSERSSRAQDQMPVGVAF